MMIGVRRDVNELLMAMDIFVMASFFEGMPNAVIEAQATGLKCIISDTITREADITGLVKYLPLGNAKVWAEAILKQENLYKRTDQTENFIREGYHIKNVTERFITLVFGD
jgi:glycosyltransferase involved in cell wall biosynthesis